MSKDVLYDGITICRQIFYESCLTQTMDASFKLGRIVPRALPSGIYGEAFYSSRVTGNLVSINILSVRAPSRI